MIELSLPVPPSANRWWRNVKGRMVLSREARKYKAALPGLAGPQTLIPAPTQVAIHVHWWRERRSGDLDKRLGVVLDALQGVCYENDSQIVEIHAYRQDDPRKGRLLVRIEEVPRPRPGSSRDHHGRGLRAAFAATPPTSTTSPSATARPRIASAWCTGPLMSSRKMPSWTTKKSWTSIPEEGA